MNKNLFFIVVFCLFLSGCATIPQGPSLGDQIQAYMDSWVGAHQSTLIAKVGPPDRTTSDGKDGSVLIYDRYIDLGQTQGRVFTDAWGNVRYTSPQQQGFTLRKLFYVNSEGNIYSWKTDAL